MRSLHAPPVSYPVGRSPLLGVLLVGLWSLAALVTLAWWLQSAPSDRWPWLGLGALGVSSLALVLGWRRVPLGRLQWDAEGWTWQSAAYPIGTAVGRPEVLLDLQSLMLIRMVNQAGAPWLVWADARSAPGQWLDLRRALHAPVHNEGANTPQAARNAPP